MLKGTDDRQTWHSLTEVGVDWGPGDRVQTSQLAGSGHVKYLNRHINDGERKDDEDEDWGGHADHDKGADDPQEAQDPAAQGHGEGIIHRGDILGTHRQEKWHTSEFLGHFTLSQLQLGTGLTGGSQWLLCLFHDVRLQ